MAHATTPTPSAVWTHSNKATLSLKILTWGGILTLAVGFVLKYVFPYYLHYNAAVYDPYWSRRGWLLLHISGGMLALLTGPWQFWSGFRQKNLQLHRWTGRLYLLGTVLGVTGGIYLALTTTYGWAFGLGLLALAWAWGSSAGLALFFVLRGQIQVHKEWMVRTYVINFAFVTFRILSDYGPMSRLQPVTDRIVSISWLCWTVPLFITEMVLQFRRLPRQRSAAR